MVKYILSISGGGIRGKIVASFLKRLEENLETSLYDKFDFFGGTSTGSLVSACLAYTKMSAKDINEKIYSHENANKIMDETFWDEILGTMQTQPKYTNTGLKEVIGMYLPKDAKMCDTEKDIIFTGFDMDKYKPVLFKSFDNRHKCIPVKDTLLISSAAPTYFPSHFCKEAKIWGIDGGVFSNNPTDCVYAEALKIYGKNEDIRILSIGTGYDFPKNEGEKTKDYGGIEWVTEGNIIDLFFNAPQIAVDYKMKVFTEALGHKYIHVNGEIENTSMDDVSEKNLKELEKM